MSWALASSLQSRACDSRLERLLSRLLSPSTLVCLLWGRFLQEPFALHQALCRFVGIDFLATLSCAFTCCRKLYFYQSGFRSLPAPSPRIGIQAQWLDVLVMLGEVSAGSCYCQSSPWLNDCFGLPCQRL